MAPISLLTAIDSTSHVHLIVGSNPLAAARCTKSLEVGAKPLLVAPESAQLHYALQKRIDNGEVEWLKKSFEDDDALRLGREEIAGVVDAVFVTSGSRDPLSIRRHFSSSSIVPNCSSCRRTYILALQTKPHTRQRCRCSCALHLCPPKHSYRRPTPNRRNNQRSRLQAFFSNPARNRLIFASLTWIFLSHLALAGDLGEEDFGEQTAEFNKLVTEADLEAARSRRMRWLSQICEYWPLRRLANITDDDVDSVLKSYFADPTTSTPLSTTLLDSRAEKKARIILAGSGPGHPDLLTRATHKAILSADIILADKLVPSGVLDLIPRRTPVHIARKFPGNAERAQEELLSLGLAGLKAGKIVLRLKQGDPYIYGRGGEELEFFRKEGYGDVISVLPGITSALSAPLFSEIPATQRGVSDQVLICTGTGRKGKPTVPPEYVTTRTVVFLMALHRIKALVVDLTTHHSEDAKVLLDDGSGEVNESRKLWPRTTPCAVIERASCPDQRVIRTTLEFVGAAIEVEGSRPPGLLVLGNACEALHKADAGRKWAVEEGFKGLDDFESAGLEELVKLGGNETSNRPDFLGRGDVLEGSSRPDVPSVDDIPT